MEKTKFKVFGKTVFRLVITMLLMGVLMCSSIMAANEKISKKAWKASKEAKASEGKLECDNCLYLSSKGQVKNIVTLEVGSKINLFPYIQYLKGEKNVRLDKAKGKKTFKSENTKICKVTKKGELKACSKGRTKVTIKYKGANLSIDVKVVKKKYSKRKDIKEVNRAIKQFYTSVKSKDDINSSNRIDILKKNAYVTECINKLYKEDTSENMIGEGYYHGYRDGLYFGVFVTPDYYKYTDARIELFNYELGSVRPNVTYQAEKVEAKEDKVVVYLSEPITSDEVFYQYQFLSPHDTEPTVEEIGDGTKAAIYMALYQPDQKETYYLKGELIVGASQIELIPYKLTESGDDPQVKLEKGNWRFGYIDEEGPYEEFVWLKNFADIVIE